ncbi:MAG: hypothetical protein CMJ27_14120, partial [Phycisphaerae bacterium]
LWGPRALFTGPLGSLGTLGQGTLPIVVPCHRIIGATDLGGFGGTGVGTSRWNQIKTSLLAAERGDRPEKSG